MDGFQRLEVMGTLGVKPEIKQIDANRRVASFRVAVNKTRKNPSTGEKVTNTTWFFCEAWNQTADFAANYLNVGSNIFAEGEISIDVVNDANGGSKTYVKFIVNNIKILPSATSSQGSANENGQNGHHKNTQQTPQNGQYVGVGPQGQQPVHQGGYQQPQAQQNGYGQGYQQPQVPQNGGGQGYQQPMQPQVPQQRPNHGNVESNVNNYMGGDNYAFQAEDDLPF